MNKLLLAITISLFIFGLNGQIKAQEAKRRHPRHKTISSLKNGWMISRK
jgi:hypothetical protein